MITKCGCYVHPNKITAIGYVDIEKEFKSIFFSYKSHHFYKVRFQLVGETYFDSKIEYQYKEDALKDIKEYSKYLPEREK